MSTPNDQTPADDTGQATPAPRPGPRPGPRPSAPRPGPTPGHRPGPVVHHIEAGDPTAFGRIDDDGNVWLTTRDGERQIGSWQAGTREEGMAHFARKFADLATETEILEERLDARSGDPRKTQAAAQHLLDELPSAQAIGDIDALTARLATIVERAGALTGEVRAERDAARAAAIARKEELAAEAEAIGSESTQWKASGDRLRVILDEWKTIRGVDRKTDDILWKRYSRARDAFNRRRGAHFAELDRERAVVKARKEELITAAEELSTSTDWGPTAAKYRELLAQWKAAGRAPRDADDALWARFKAAQDVFFAARNAVHSERDAEFGQNAEAKSALLSEYEKTIDPGSGLEAARREFRTFRERWEEIGKVPREQMHALEGRARALEKRIRDAEEADWSRTDPEALARAAQFAERAAKLSEQADKAAAAGKDRDAAKLREQAAQWTEWAEAAKSAVDGR
ncbi:DUF349 domain-containing protein [Gordonia sp. (in: high G+C Gram-positive bacteria)]|uniref:DUF349 domain-containing protein n=1 Tax=unclassified Gordonia (in: high G+C Gram-positive bacteria) TaxID=2657482 RepID=UPI0026075E50|nr:DUF349 domain-containing protein [Gordonia sp. (in: high G+C Gram-positive bacteria)]